MDLSGVNTYLNPPFTGRIAWEGKSQHVITVLIQKWRRMIKEDKPTRAVMLIPEPTDADGGQFLQEAVKAGGQVFLSIQNGQRFFLSPIAHKYEKAESWGNYSGRIHFVLFQNQAAGILYPIHSSSLSERIKQWAEKRSINYKQYQISSSVRRTQTVPMNSREHCSILRFYHRIEPQKGQLDCAVRNKKMRKWIEEINQADRVAMMAGFIPTSLHEMIRHFRPQTYKEDEKKLRLIILEAHEKTYNLYSSMKKRWDLILQMAEKGKKKEKIKFPTQPAIEEKKERTRKRSTNVHTDYQDQKKKRKKMDKKGGSGERGSKVS